MTRARTGQAAAIGRSLRLYHGDPERIDRMAGFYGSFLAPGGLAFDIGAHVGDRARAFRQIGARVVAVEPQPAVHRALRLIMRRDPLVTLVAAALGAEAGRMPLHLNAENPTVSTLSQSFVDAAAGAPGWEGQAWSARVEVPVMTVDALIATHGTPDFIKIDVEGHEADVLAGLNRPIGALSFEITTIHRPVAFAAIDRLAALGDYRFALSLGETFVFDTGWETAQAMRDRVAALPLQANSGDVYAALATRLPRLVPAGAAR